MTEKIKPIGICDLCGGSIPERRWYTKHGPRIYCSFECRQIGNSRNGAAARSAKAKKRVRLGKWKNPMSYLTPEKTSAKNSQAARKGRLRELAEGHWRNPALSDQARRKLSRPRKHHGALHRAIEKLRHGKMSDLTEQEKRAYRAYRKKLRRNK